MNAHHRRTLARIFKDPVTADLRWSDIEALFRSVDAEIGEGVGSRVRVALKGVRAVFHRPHPTPTTKRTAVRSVRTFLTAAGIRPQRD